VQDVRLPCNQNQRQAGEAHPALNIEMRYREISENLSAYDLKVTYDKFNAAYFSGELPNIPVVFAPLKGVGGVVKCRTSYKGPMKKNSRGKWAAAVPLRLRDQYTSLVPGSMILQISNTFKRTPEIIDGFLLHEMVHVFFNHAGEFNENHGYKFLAKLREISKLSGIRIPLKDNTEDEELTNDMVLKAVGVILIKKEGTYSFRLLTPKLAHAERENIKKSWEYTLNVANYYSDVWLFTIATPEWTKMSLRIPVARVVRGTFYMLNSNNSNKDDAAIDNILSAGHQLFHIQK